MQIPRSQSTMSTSFFKRDLVSNPRKKVAQPGLCAKLPFIFSSKSMTNLSLLRPPISAKLVLAATATFAARLTAIVSTILTTRNKLSIAPRKLLVSSGVSYISPVFLNREVPRTLGKMYTSGSYAFDTREMPAAGPADSTVPHSGPTGNISDVGVCELGNNDVFKIPVDGPLLGKKVSVIVFYTQMYNHERKWFFISLVDEIASSYRVVS